MKVGDSARTRRQFTSAEVAQWQALTGGHDTSGIVPNPLVASLFSYLLGVELPGAGTNYLKQEIEWLAPAPLDSVLTASVSITRLRPEKSLVDLATRCTDESGNEICTGRALVYVGEVMS
ncbi:hypothetical protein GCM10011342_28770 [Aquisalinus flavus]|uniref:Phosphate acetyltransferase n=1 Tax=Aquisalinus flavus TaxID=1526572 RepID=A0A8J2V5A4_9PROT|nr:phosphate acetyltransferase [Aquisalinus flavus]MBD0428144.1 phosphate acetyltransferase [Aquisalinus flavus]GGD18328.1 hypothetical protein GCM10011342_28770 [Aquisalinus flavus]